MKIFSVEEFFLENFQWYQCIGSEGEWEKLIDWNLSNVTIHVCLNNSRKLFTCTSKKILPNSLIRFILIWCFESVLNRSKFEIKGIHIDEMRDSIFFINVSIDPFSLFRVSLRLIHIHISIEGSWGLFSVIVIVLNKKL